MNLLLDSHAALWWATGSGSLSRTTVEVIDGATSVAVSLATPWELQIKVKAGKLDLAGADWNDLERRGVAILSPTLLEVLASADLPNHHRDPFDRLIIAQAIHRGLTVVTRDRDFAAYGVPIIVA